MSLNIKPNIAVFCICIVLAVVTILTVFIFHSDQSSQEKLNEYILDESRSLLYESKITSLHNNYLDAEKSGLVESESYTVNGNQTRTSYYLSTELRHVFEAEFTTDSSNRVVEFQGRNVSNAIETDIVIVLLNNSEHSYLSKELDQSTKATVVLVGGSEKLSEDPVIRSIVLPSELVSADIEPQLLVNSYELAKTLDERSIMTIDNFSSFIPPKKSN